MKSTTNRRTALKNIATGAGALSLPLSIPSRNDDLASLKQGVTICDVA